MANPSGPNVTLDDFVREFFTKMQSGTYDEVLMRDHHATTIDEMTRHYVDPHFRPLSPPIEGEFTVIATEDFPGDRSP